MALSLDKGATLDLSKAAEDAGTTLSTVLIGAGWDTDNGEFDADLSIVLTDANGKALSDKHIVFYNQPSFGSIATHSGDNRTGAGDGDDESIKVDLSQLESGVEKVVVVATIHEAKGATFSDVANLYVRVADEGNGTELGRYDLGKAELAGTDSGVVAEIVRSGSAWTFAANSKAMSGSLAGALGEFGLA